MRLSGWVRRVRSIGTSDLSDFRIGWGQLIDLGDWGPDSCTKCVRCGGQFHDGEAAWLCLPGLLGSLGMAALTLPCERRSRTMSDSASVHFFNPIMNCSLLRQWRGMTLRWYWIHSNVMPFRVFRLESQRRAVRGHFHTSSHHSHHPMSTVVPVIKIGFRSLNVMVSAQISDAPGPLDAAQ